jgi:hypothetical protein
MNTNDPRVTPHRPPVVAILNSNDDLVELLLVPPYDRSWNYLDLLRDSEPLRGRPFVLTSVNAARAAEVVGDSEMVYEIIGKPLDLDRVVAAVKEASKARLTARARRPT